MKNEMSVCRWLAIGLGLRWIRSARNLDAFAVRLAAVRRWAAFAGQDSVDVPERFRAAYDCVVGGGPQVIVSLTSYPARIRIVHQVVESILKQSFKPNRIMLWLATSQFPRGDRELPAALMALCCRGLEIRWCEDIKSYKKLLPALRKQADAVIVTVDDDVTYERDMLAELLQDHLRNPRMVLCHAVSKIERKPSGAFVRTSGRCHPGGSFYNQPVGMGGVLYPPGCFDAGIVDEALAMRLAPTNDDLWFWLHAICGGCKVKMLPYRKASRFFHIDGSQDEALWRKNDVGENLYWRDFDRLRRHYADFRRLLEECPFAESCGRRSLK